MADWAWSLGGIGRRRAVSVAACPCGRVPLNAGERATCPRCGRVAPLVMRPSAGVWRPEPQGRVVWGV